MRRVFLLLERATWEDDEEEVVQPLIDWLCVSLTRGSAAAETPSLVTLLTPLSVPMVTSELAERLHQLVKGNLPAWQQTVAPSTTHKPPAAQTTQQQQDPPTWLSGCECVLWDRGRGFDSHLGG